MRTKFLWFAALIVTVPALVFGVIAYSRSAAALDRVIGRHLASEAGNTGDALASALGEARDIARRASRQDLMRDVRVGDIDKRVSAFLATLKQGTPACLDFLVIDSVGSVVAASQPALLGTWTGARVPVERALAGEEVLFGPQPAAGYGKKALYVGGPVYDPDDPRRILASFVGIYDWDRITRSVDETREKLAELGLAADVLIVDQASNVIRAALGSGVGAFDRGRLDPPSWGALDVAFGDRVTGTFRAGGQQFLAGRAGLAAGLPPWRVIVAEPLQSALAPVRRMAGQLALALAVTLFAALVLAAVGVGRVVRPLSRLTTAIREFASGASDNGPPEPVAVVGRDEVAVLAHAFNRMASELSQAQRELVEAAKFAFVGELAAGVAHEVRTPLGVLRSAAQILERSLSGAEDAQTVELVGMMRNEVDRVGRVVDGLLNLARPRDLQLERVHLEELVLRAAEFVETQARERGITLVRKGTGLDATAHGDRELVYQVALNLLVNAVQMLDEGGTVEIVLLPPRGGMVGFEVRDDGPGISPEKQREIFRPFVTEREGGTGLGLTFVQRVVQEHRGRLTLESEIGAGSCFRVELPTGKSET